MSEHGGGGRRGGRGREISGFSLPRRDGGMSTGELIGHLMIGAGTLLLYWSRSVRIRGEDEPS